MFGCCSCWDSDSDSGDFLPLEPPPNSLPAPLPEWPEGHGFATGRINLGEIEVAKVSNFQSVWCSTKLSKKAKDVTFYKPVEVPDGFFSLGDYCQPDDQAQRGYVLVARDVTATNDSESDSSALRKPIDYTLIWSSDSNDDGSVCIWQPNAAVGYKAMGFVVTDEPKQPELDDVRCVRADLTTSCELYEMILGVSSDSFQVWNTRPCKRGMLGRGVFVGTFFCSTDSSSGDEPNIACLKNLNSTLDAMPNLDQIHALIKHYGPTVFFHPEEAYFPSSVPWFFKNGALLYRNGSSKGEAIDSWGSNLPKGGKNDGEFWMDLPEDDGERDYLKSGNIESAKLYVHVKSALGGTFTDIAMWIFCPFNGPATFKLAFLDIAMNKIGEHVGDWEHFTLRLSNFTGELWSVYFSEHSGGEWVNASDLEFIEGNKPIVYSAKSGHASFPHAGTYIEGTLGIGVRNDTAQSDYSLDASVQYEIIAVEYLGKGAVTEPDWLQYMREWGPTVLYDSSTELEKIIKHLPFFVRFTVESFFELFPDALYGEEGPTGPKEKDNWLGDERT